MSGEAENDPSRAAAGKRASRASGGGAVDGAGSGDAKPRRASVTRRTAVECAVGVAVMFALGGASKAFAGEGDFLRPPGGADYGRFVGACVKCDRCRSACPRNAISVCMLDDGIVNARLPKMNFRRGYCDTCDGAYKCIAACPTGALSPADIEAEPLGIAVIDTAECLTYGVSAHCSAPCIDACEWRALSLDASGHLQIEDDLCTGCGACEYVCPSDSYGSFSSSSSNRGINVVPAASR